MCVCVVLFVLLGSELFTCHEFVYSVVSLVDIFSTWWFEYILILCFSYFAFSGPTVLGFGEGIVLDINVCVFVLV